jgi:soluble lytic murein transglycosylase-like protein
MTSGLVAAALVGLIAAVVGVLGQLVLPASRLPGPAATAGAPRVRATPTEARWIASEGATTTSVLLRPAPRAAQPPAAPAQVPVGPMAPAALPPTAAEVPKPARLNEAVPAAIRRWEPLILRHAAANELDPHLLAALMHVESAGREDAVSPKNAIGLMQVLHGPTDPEENVALGARILAGHVKTFGDLDLALAAYNAGPGAVREHGGVPPYDETRWHVYLTRWWYWAYSQ